MLITSRPAVVLRHGSCSVLSPPIVPDHELAVSILRILPGPGRRGRRAPRDQHQPRRQPQQLHGEQPRAAAGGGGGGGVRVARVAELRGRGAHVPHPPVQEDHQAAARAEAKSED